MLYTIALILLTYLFASIPFGVVLCVIIADADPRDSGSGNIGATNVYRLFGARLGLLTLLLDVLKGWLPTLAVLLIDGPQTAGWVALAALAGHCYSAYLSLRGGKGVATAAGVLLALQPLICLMLLLLWGIGFIASQRASIGALVAAAALPLLTLLLAPELWWTTLALAAIVMLRHRDNIQRLIHQAEPATHHAGPAGAAASGRRDAQRELDDHGGE